MKQKHSQLLRQRNGLLAALILTMITLVAVSLSSLGVKRDEAEPAPNPTLEAVWDMLTNMPTSTPTVRPTPLPTAVPAPLVYSFEGVGEFISEKFTLREGLYSYRLTTDGWSGMAVSLKSDDDCVSPYALPWTFFEPGSDIGMTTRSLDCDVYLWVTTAKDAVWSVKFERKS